MYNHYIPQSDGSYRRNSQQEPRRPKSKPEPPKECPPKPQQKPECPPEPPRQTGVMDFLRGLLPRQIDTADLLIICLLLLMNQDDEGGLSPVLTLALYFLL